MSKPNYRLILAFDSARQVFQATIPELQHCTAEGATRAEAIAKAEEEINAQLANMLSHGSTPPKAIDEEDFSGEISAKISRGLHRDLAYLARQDGVELDQYLGELLSAALESRRSSRGPRGSATRPPADDAGNRAEGHGGGGAGGNTRGGNFRGGGRGQYNPALEDRANFIEYVRGLEHGAAPNRGGGGGGGGPGGGGRDRDAGRRRRGGRGGGFQGGQGQGGQGGQRRDFQNQNGGGRRDLPPREAAPAAAAPSAAPPSAGGGEPEPGNT